MTGSSIWRLYTGGAVSGPERSTHAYVLNAQGLQHFADTGQTDRGLGVSRTPTVRYFQAEVDNGAFLFTTDDPPSSWTDMNLVSETFPGLEQMRRRLLSQASPNFRMTLTQLSPGQGRINLIRTGVRPAGMPQKEPSEKPLKPTEQPVQEQPVESIPPAPAEELEAQPVVDAAAPEEVDEPKPQSPEEPELSPSVEETGPALRPQPQPQRHPQSSSQRLWLTCDLSRNRTARKLSGGSDRIRKRASRPGKPWRSRKPESKRMA